MSVDAETYLRCRLEDVLLAGHGRHGSDLLDRARAAVAVGALAQDVAEAVLRDLRRASDLRERHHEQEHTLSPAPRVVVCPTVIEQDWGSMVITHVVLGRHETKLGVMGHLRRPAQALGRHRHDWPWDDLEVIDSAGGKHEASFGGSSSDESFDGQYHVSPPLDRDMTALTIGGTVVELNHRPAEREVRVARVDEADPAALAARHLGLIASRERLRSHPRSFDDGHDGLGAARETFVALGIPLPQTAAETSPGATARRSHRGRRSRSTSAPARRWVGIAATLPVTDGLMITLTTLSDDGVVEVVGATEGRLNEDGRWPLMSVSAVDDAGARYTAEEAQRSYGGRTFEGGYRFEPPLRSDARTLTVAIDTLRHHVEIDVPLDWQDAR